MVSRASTNKTIRRRAGGTGKRTSGKGTTVEQINREKGTCEIVPGTGTSPYNPPKWRKKKRPPAPPTGAGLDFPTSEKKIRRRDAYGVAPPTRKRTYRENPSEAIDPVLKNKAMREEARRQLEAEKARKRRAAAERAAPLADTKDMLPAIKRKGGTIKKKHGGTPKKKYSKGGSVSRRGGGKIMIGYKAGGKV